MSELLEPPRKLAESSKRSLFWGSSLLTLSLSGGALVTLGLLIGVLIYQLGWSSWRARQAETVRAESQIAKIDWVRLPAGGARAAVAPVRINDVVLEVNGFGPPVESARVGDKVTVAVPKTAPRMAYLEGFWPTPVSLATLLKIAGCFYLPCLAWAGLTWMRGRRLERLLTEGEVVQAHRKKGFSLPRPLFDYQFVQWEIQEGETFWSLTPKSPAPPTLLCLGRNRVFLESVLSNPRTEDGAVHCDDSVSRLVGRLNRFLLGLNLFLLGAFVFT